jgi:hypothetical protein
MLSEADFTESLTGKTMLNAPDLEQWMTAVKLESDTLVKWATGRSLIFLQMLSF